jgi:hypothetical protein
VPHSKRIHTFWTTVGNAPAARTRLGSVPFGNDAHYAACRNRLIRQHIAKHRPASVVDGFCHPRLRQLSRACVPDVNFRVVLHDPVRHDVEEMLSPVGNLCRQCSTASFLPTPLRPRQLLLLLLVQLGSGNLQPVGEGSDALEPRIDADCGAVASCRFFFAKLTARACLRRVRRIEGLASLMRYRYVRIARST